MTRRAAVTKDELRRRIEAMQAAGLSIAGVAPDGTILVGRPIDKPAAATHDAPGLKSPEAALAELREWAR